MIVPLARATAAEWFRFRRRRFAWVALATVVVSGFLGAVAPQVTARATGLSERIGGGTVRDTVENAFYYLAAGGRGVALLAALFVALAAAPSISGELSNGTLRLALARPVKRTSIFLAKALVLGGFAQALLIAGLLAALAGAAVASDFGPVTRSGFTKSDVSSMVGRAAFAAALCDLAILGVLGLSLLASTVADAVASSTSATFGILVILALGSYGFDVAKPYVFAAYTTSPFDTLQDFALGIDAPRPKWFGVASLQDWADAAFAALVPAATAAALFGTASRIFTRRDWLA